MALIAAYYGIIDVVSGNHLTLTANGSVASGVITCDGSGEAATTTAALFTVTGGTMSVQFDFKPASVTGPRTMFEFPSPSDGDWGEAFQVYLNGNVFGGATNNSSGAHTALTSGETHVSIGTWYHARLTRVTSGEFNLYLDASNFQKSAPVTDPLYSGQTSTMVVGGDSQWGEYFQGDIKNLRVYDSVALEDTTNVVAPIALVATPEPEKTARISTMHTDARQAPIRSAPKERTQGVLWPQMEG